jgi:Mlc titration factor MtfA (ptsG expression regulator)
MLCRQPKCVFYGITGQTFPVMFSFVNSSLLYHLLITDFILMLSFLYVYQHYAELKIKIDECSTVKNPINEKYRKFLRLRFPFYNRLSPMLITYFETAVMEFYHSKNFISTDDKRVKNKIKFIIAAYAAQVSFGIRGYTFPSIKNIVIHSHKFESNNGSGYVSWELEDNGIAISMEDLYQKREEEIGSLGLVIMAAILKRENNQLFKELVLKVQDADYRIDKSEALHKRSKSLFEENEMRDKDAFIEACIKYYFTHPLDLRNQHPKLFRKIDLMLYRNVAGNF